MKKHCAFTIVAKNYLGLANVLKSSVLKYSKETDFHIVIADELEIGQRDLLLNKDSKALIAREILDKESEWVNLTFKYTVTEFCTAIKPASIQYFLNQGYEKVMYLDPDICFFNDIDDVFSELCDADFMIVPHLALLPEKKDDIIGEEIFLKFGIFNLGFICVRKSETSFKMLKWWDIRLKDGAFSNGVLGQYTDQKWMDFLPGFFNSHQLKICNNLGYDVAPWNFNEREILLHDNRFYVTGRKEQTVEVPLMFVHFAGYDFRKLSNGEIVQKYYRKIPRYKDTDLILAEYVNLIAEKRKEFEQYLSLDYTYAAYSNGDRIHPLHRAIYNSLMMKGNRIIENPFNGDGALYDVMKRTRLLTKDSNIPNGNTGNSANSSKTFLKKSFSRFSRLIIRYFGVNRYIKFLNLIRELSYLDNQANILNVSEKLEKR